MSNLRIEKDGNVAIMVWQRAPQNQFNTEFLKEIVAALAELAADRDVKALVITSGVEKYYSTGLHLEWIMQEAMQNPPGVPEFFGMINKFMIEITAFPKPVIAAINGHCVAMGAIITASMDFRLMSPDKGFVRLPEVEINIPFLPGMRAIFKDILTPQAWRNLAYTSDRFTGEQAHAMGYVDALHPQDELLGAAVALADKLGRFKMSTYAAIKRDNRADVLRIMREEDPPAIQAMLKTFGGG
ncbi:MAG: enoyl-CoA hydratase/isomerase family protein [Candidatus Lernaella stagnicola]|nr:enoyl-CoA hydratase/isomerase family protein [Candidatus Lernaella stagnicola]